MKVGIKTNFRQNHHKTAKNRWRRAGPPRDNELVGARPPERHSSLSLSRARIGVHRKAIHYWRYFIFFAMAGYESNVSGFGNIPGISHYQFKPIRLDLPKLYSNLVLDLKNLLFRHRTIDNLVWSCVIRYFH